MLTRTMTVLVVACLLAVLPAWSVAGAAEAALREAKAVKRAGLEDGPSRGTRQVSTAAVREMISVSAVTEDARREVLLSQTLPWTFWERHKFLKAWLASMRHRKHPHEVKAEEWGILSTLFQVNREKACRRLDLAFETLAKADPELRDRRSSVPTPLPEPPLRRLPRKKPLSGPLRVPAPTPRWRGRPSAEDDELGLPDDELE